MKPEKVFRVGSVSASVFVNKIDTENGKREIRNVNLQRRYKDGDGEWQSSSSFGLGLRQQGRYRKRQAGDQKRQPATPLQGRRR